MFIKLTGNCNIKGFVSTKGEEEFYINTEQIVCLQTPKLSSDKYMCVHASDCSYYYLDSENANILLTALQCVD